MASRPCPRRRPKAAGRCSDPRSPLRSAHRHGRGPPADAPARAAATCASSSNRAHPRTAHDFRHSASSCSRAKPQLLELGDSGRAGEIPQLVRRVLMCSDHEFQPVAGLRAGLSQSQHAPRSRRARHRSRARPAARGLPGRAPTSVPTRRRPPRPLGARSPSSFAARAARSSEAQRSSKVPAGSTSSGSAGPPTSLRPAASNARRPSNSEISPRRCSILASTRSRAARSLRANCRAARHSSTPSGDSGTPKPCSCFQSPNLARSASSSPAARRSDSAEALCRPTAAASRRRSSSSDRSRSRAASILSAAVSTSESLGVSARPSELASSATLVATCSLACAKLSRRAGPAALTRRRDATASVKSAPPPAAAKSGEEDTSRRPAR